MFIGLTLWAHSHLMYTMSIYKLYNANYSQLNNKSQLTINYKIPISGIIIEINYNKSFL